MPCSNALHAWREFDASLLAAPLNLTLDLAIIKSLSNKLEEGHSRFKRHALYALPLDFAIETQDSNNDNNKAPTTIGLHDRHVDPFIYRKGGRMLHPKRLHGSLHRCLDHRRQEQDQDFR